MTDQKFELSTEAADDLVRILQHVGLKERLHFLDLVEEDNLQEAQKDFDQNTQLAILMSLLDHDVFSQIFPDDLVRVRYLLSEYERFHEGEPNQAILLFDKIFKSKFLNELDSENLATFISELKESFSGPEHKAFQRKISTTLYKSGLADKIKDKVDIKYNTL